MTKNQLIFINMKKISIIILLSIFSIVTLNAQAMGKGSRQLNAGLGFSGWGMPVYVGIDFGLSKEFSLGIEGSFRSYSNNWGGGSYSHTIFGFLGNANYHFNTIMNIPSDWDFYAGLNLGFYSWSSSAGYAGSGNSGLGFGLQVGGRYYFNNKFGINLEFEGGNSISGGKIGITYKWR
jgi:outer membrane immunogenic protein